MKRKKNRFKPDYYTQTIRKTIYIGTHTLMHVTPMELVGKVIPLNLDHRLMYNQRQCNNKSSQILYQIRHTKLSRAHPITYLAINQIHMAMDPQYI